MVATGGGVALHQQQPRAAPSQESLLRGGNALDSSAPTVRRGKERETPKKKRPSALRKVSTVCLILHNSFYKQVIAREKTDRSKAVESAAIPDGRETILKETGQSEADVNGVVEQVCCVKEVSTTTTPTSRIHNRKFRE